MSADRKPEEPRRLSIGEQAHSTQARLEDTGHRVVRVEFIPAGCQTLITYAVETSAPITEQFIYEPLPFVVTEKALREAMS